MAINNHTSCNTVVQFASYNMYGFNSGLPMLQEMCKTYDIILIQEHWLQTCDLHKLSLIDNNFSCLAVSAMDSKCGNGILHGRPFRGTGVLWRRRLADIGLHMKLIEKDVDGRYISVMLSKYKIIITCVYLPSHSTNMANTVEVGAIFAHLEAILDKYVGCLHILAGDFNFVCNSSQHGYNLFTNLCFTYNLKCMDNELDDCGYTYCSEALGHRSWIDHVFVSKSLCESFAHFTILDSGCNNSDHNPITWQLNWSDVHNVTHKQQQHHHSSQMCLDKADIGLQFNRSIVTSN